jgi:MoxR-like ATPase
MSDLKKKGESPVSDAMKQDARDLAARFRDVSKIVIGIDDILAQMLLALLTREHCLWTGDPGRAKSFTARIVFGMLEGANAFKQQINQDMLPSALFGSPIPKEYMDTGKEISCLEGGLAQCDLALLEEFYDGNRALIRSVHTAMHERLYETKDQRVRVPLHTAILTTNWRQEDKASEAGRDRVIFKAVFPDLPGLIDRLRMYGSYLSYAGEIPTVEPFPFGKVKAMAALVESPDGIPVPMAVQVLHAMVVGRFRELRAERAKAEALKSFAAAPGAGKVTDVDVEDLPVPGVTPRTENKLLDIVRAAAFLRGRDVVDFDDVEIVRYGLFVANDGSGDRELFEKAWGELKPSARSRSSLEKLGHVAAKIVELKTNPPESIGEIVVDFGGKVETYTKATIIEWLDQLTTGGSVVAEVAKALKAEIESLRPAGSRPLDDLLKP